MCAVFGFLDYGRKIPHKVLARLVQALAKAAEERGTDAAGISYIKNGKVTIYKRPKAAHKLRFRIPYGTRAVMGHTRFTTQGSEKQNYNNHPFYGQADKAFALAHNGVLYNDTALRKAKSLPDTHIETDSYIAVQLVEKQGALNFTTLRHMAEDVHGSFVFTILGDDNTLYISKGDNPLCLLHFKKIGLYVYTSTRQIMANVIKGSFLENYHFEVIVAEEGEIIRIDKHGVLTKDCYVPDCGCTGCVGGSYYEFYDKADPEGYLYDVCNMFGLAPEELSLLYEMGYDNDEIEEMIQDRQYLQLCINDARAIIGERF